jgi:hypothetical protein
MSNKQPMFFGSEHEEMCYGINHFTDSMNEGESLIILKAVPCNHSDVFWCKEFTEMMEKNQGGCGKSCEYYEPRNGRSGCCKSHSHVYCHGEATTIKIENGKPIFINN